MEFRIADTFTDSLARLAGDEQKAVKITVFDLQANPVSTGMQLHKLDKAKDKKFWSVRVNRDIRLIVHKTASSLLICYVDHHDDAYRWAERRKLEVHPKTGAAQFVIVRETVVEIAIRKAVEAVVTKPRLFESSSDAELLGYGVPQEWLSDVRQVNEDTLLEVAEYLPEEAAEMLLAIATQSPAQARLLQVFSGESASDDAGATLYLMADDLDIVQTGAETPLDHPEDTGFSHRDAQRRFRLIENREELERALEYPWEKWATFLHPTQKELVEGDYSGPARVSGSAGTGKTIVAIHRAAFLARSNPDARVLLTTFSETLASALRTKLRRLIGNEPRLRERIDVESISATGQRLYESHSGPASMASAAEIEALLTEAGAATPGHKFGKRFLRAEWNDVVDAWQLDSWEAYRDVKRLGRKTRLPEKQRALLWAIFDRVRSSLTAKKLVTQSQMFHAAAAILSARRYPPFDHVIVDEAQDVSVAQLRFLAAFGGHQHNRLFFTGDLGQRIFQLPFSWKSLGVDLRGRSRMLRVNYRTSHQIRAHADRLLGPEVADIDGNVEDRRGTISVFNGPTPEIQIAESLETESRAVSEWLVQRAKEGIVPHEMAVFVRSEGEIIRAKRAVELAKLPMKVLDDRVETVHGHVSVATMHLAKGLEFRAVAVMACDDEIVPLQARIQAVTDDSDLEEVYNTERHLLYVACTRTRDHLWVSAVRPASEFLDDLSR